MDPNQLPPEEENVELEAIARQGIEAEDTRKGIEANTEASAMKLNDMEQNQEAQLLQGMKAQDTYDQIAKNTDPNTPQKVEIDSHEAMHKLFFSMIRGRDGKEGPQGAPGRDGRDGKDGKDGADGKMGVDGKDGKVGPRGPQGPMGPAGKDGVDGVDGKDGKDGKDAVVPVRGTDYYTEEDIAEMAVRMKDEVTPEAVAAARKSVASRTYSVSELEGMLDATTGQVPTKQADGSWAPETPSGGGGISDGDKGDITVSGSGATWTIDDEAVTLAKMAHVATNRMLGRSSAGTGDVEALTATQARDNMNVGTGDSPQFAGVNVGHATDTTITRVSAGVIAVEGNNVQLEPAEGGFADGDKTKLDGIEASADVTDVTNVTAAGALMDSELTDETAVKAINQGLATTDNVQFVDVQYTGEIYNDAEVDDGNSSTADTIDWTTGPFHKSTMTGNCTYTFTAPSGPARIQLKLVQDATGSRTATWPAAVKWPAGTAPTLSTSANAEDIITFYYDGTSYYGVDSLNFS